jgi:pentatricopeptide repeat protein
MCGMGFLEVTPTVSLYTCALEFLLKQNNGEDFEYLYNRMLQDGLVPDQKLFEILIKGCSKIGKCDAAVSFFESMKNQGFVPHVSVYITTIGHLSVCGNLDCGHWFYKEMIASGCLPSVFGIHEVACALYGDEIKKRIEEFENVVQLMPSLSRVHSFNNLIRFLLDIGKPDEATVVFNRLKSGTPITTEGARQTPTWNVDSYRSYIFGMYKLGHVVNAMETYVELLSRGPKPTNDISSFLLLNLSREKLMVEALDVCKRIIKCRDPIDIAAQKAFFTLLRIKKHLDVACKLFMTMRKKRCIDEDSDFTSLVGFNEDKHDALAS